jgi:hypothetical protein
MPKNTIEMSNLVSPQKNRRYNNSKMDFPKNYTSNIK